MAVQDMQAIENALELFDASQEVEDEALRRKWLAAAIRTFGRKGSLGKGHYILLADCIEGSLYRDWTGASLALFDMRLFCDSQVYSQELQDRVRELMDAADKAATNRGEVDDSLEE